MAERSEPAEFLPRAAAALRRRSGVLRKALSFALIGVVNTVVDAAVFFLAYGYFTASGAAAQLFAGASALCRCGAPENLALIAANVLGWIVGVSCSYVLNSSITFAAESGRRLRVRAYAAFAASGVLGAVTNTATLVLVAQVAPVWVAKGCAILVSFAVNFSMSHFVVFRPRRG